MNVTLKEIRGPWDAGWVLDKHIVRSVCVGENAYGHPVFETTRTEIGEATYQLKYKGQFDQVEPLAHALATHIYPKLNSVGFIVPMPASKSRPRQPVTEVAEALGRVVQKPVVLDLLRKLGNGTSLKDLRSKEEKVEAIGDSFSINDRIRGDGPWNVLVVDDLFDTGASMEAACKVLRAYKKVKYIYVAALTWK